MPAGLAKVVAISGNLDYCLALKSDGTVVGWRNVPALPPGLSGVAAIAAGEAHWLALLSNGTVVAWGDDSSGESNVPSSGLHSARAVLIVGA